jgi:hypothetical protein
MPQRTKWPDRIRRTFIIFDALRCWPNRGILPPALRHPMVAWRDIGHNVAIELLDSITLELTTVGPRSEWKLTGS